jgi:uncharacterized membrane protein (Fun14 family)
MYSSSSGRMSVVVIVYTNYIVDIDLCSAFPTGVGLNTGTTSAIVLNGNYKMVGWGSGYTLGLSTGYSSQTPIEISFDLIKSKTVAAVAIATDAVIVIDTGMCTYIYESCIY